MANSLGCSHKEWPSEYLDLPLGGSSRMRDLWNLVIDSLFLLVFHVSSIFLPWNQKSFRVSYLRPQIGTSISIEIFRDPEIVELSSLLVLLYNFYLSPSCLDSCLWSLTCSSFSQYPLFFFFFAISLHLSSESFCHKKIWASPIHSNIQAFLWKIVWNCAPTIDVIQSFKSNITLMHIVCSLCLYEAEP